MKRALLLLFLASLAAGPVQARLGETLKEIELRNGKAQPKTQKAAKNAAVWLIEGSDGQLIYTATFDAQGYSIAEGLKPVRYAKFPKETVQSFIRVQLEPYRDSKTIRTAKPGEKYSFAGQIHTAGPQETVVVDEANDFIIVWIDSAMPSVMAARSVLMR
jgi:hypothetical protein